MTTNKLYGPFHLYEEKFDWRGRLLSIKDCDEEVFVQVSDSHASATLAAANRSGGIFGLSATSSKGFGLKPKVSLDKPIPMMGNRTERILIEGKKELRIQKGFIGSSHVDVYVGSNMELLCHGNKHENLTAKTNSDIVIWIPDFFKKIRLSVMSHNASATSSTTATALLHQDYMGSAVKKNHTLVPSTYNSSILAAQHLQKLRQALIGSSAVRSTLGIADTKEDNRDDAIDKENTINNVQPTNKVQNLPAKQHLMSQTQEIRGFLAPYRGNTQQPSTINPDDNDCPLRSDAFLSTAVDVYDVLFDALDTHSDGIIPDQIENDDIFADKHDDTEQESQSALQSKRRPNLIRDGSGYTPQLKRCIVPSSFMTENDEDPMSLLISSDGQNASPCKSSPQATYDENLSLNSPTTIETKSNKKSTIDSHFKRIPKPSVNEINEKPKRMFSFGRDDNNNKIEAVSESIHLNEGRKSSSSSSSSRQQPTQSVIRNLTTDSHFVKEYHFSDQQHAIIQACVERGENVFYTGGGGTGKSVLLKHLVDLLVTKHGKSKVFVTATTGLSACAIGKSFVVVDESGLRLMTVLGGTTLHQFLSLPALDENDNIENWNQALEKTCSKKHIVMRCKQAQVLIIDEISMLGPRLFELLDSALKQMRESSSPMGGLQWICCGDFLQLPPIKSCHSNSGPSIATYVTKSAQIRNDRRYCFQSPVWQQTFPWNHCYELENVYRQEGDSTFIDMLNDIRKGIVTETTARLLRETVGRRLEEHYGILPTVIFTHKKDVDTMNQQRLKNLHGEAFVYTSKDHADDRSAMRTLQYSCPARDKITLKIGAQVILVKTLNVSMGLVNGARGIVVRIIKDTKAPVVRFFDGQEHVIVHENFSLSIGGNVVAQRSQIPLDLAWAISVHKAQGMTVDQAELHLKNTFECGQAYVALSRVRSRRGLSLKYPIGVQQIKADPIVLQFYSTLKQQQSLSSIKNPLNHSVN